MKKFLVVAALAVGFFCYAGSDLAKHNKAVVTETAKDLGSKAAASAGAALTEAAPHIKH